MRTIVKNEKIWVRMVLSVSYQKKIFEFKQKIFFKFC